MSKEHNAFEDLEAELGKFAPSKPSEALKQRVETDLDLVQPSQTLGRRRWAVLAIATAACLAGGLVLWQFNFRPLPDPAVELQPQPELATIPPQPATIVLKDSTAFEPTSLTAYRQAAFESPQALEAMLDRDADALLFRSEPISLAVLD